MLYPVLGWVFVWLWLCFLTWPNWGLGGGRGWKFHFPICLIIFPYQGIISQKKFPQKKMVLWPQLGGGGRPLCGGHHPKVPLFFDAAPYLSLNVSLFFISGASPQQSFYHSPFLTSVTRGGAWPIICICFRTGYLCIFSSLSALFGAFSTEHLL